MHPRRRRSAAVAALTLLTPALCAAASASPDPTGGSVVTCLARPGIVYGFGEVARSVVPAHRDVAAALLRTPASTAPTARPWPCAAPSTAGPATLRTA